jgi:hypothetical protein
MGSRTAPYITAMSLFELESDCIYSKQVVPRFIIVPEACLLQDFFIFGKKD